MIRRIKEFSTLVETPPELWLFLRIGLWILIVTILLRATAINRMMTILAPRKSSPGKFKREKIVNFTSFWLGRERAFLQRSCLKRSLVLFRYLNMQSERARFFIGVRKENGELRGHSWITVDGKSLFPEDDLNYKTVFSHPQSE